MMTSSGTYATVGNNNSIYAYEDSLE